jgi:sulfur-oxidizing protein SoxY
MDQLTRTYAVPHFVRRIDVHYGSKLVLSADVDFSISENPNFRFYFVPGGEDELDASGIDNQDLEFTTSLKVSPTHVGAASAAH